MSVRASRHRGPRVAGARIGPRSNTADLRLLAESRSVMRVPLRALALSLAAVMLLSASARAEFPSEVPDRFQLGLGGMFGVFDTGIALGPATSSVNVMIVLEDALGLSVHDGFLTTDGFWRF